LLRGLYRDPSARYASAMEMTTVLEEAFVRPWQKAGIQLVTIPTGPFLSGQGDTAQIRQLPAFDIMRFPVTVAQFAAFVAETGYITLAEQEGWGIEPFSPMWAIAGFTCGGEVSCVSSPPITPRCSNSSP
jgi:formylglycine-generating enzyme required for sulfatase activity